MKYYGVGCLPCHNFIFESISDRVKLKADSLTATIHTLGEGCAAGITSQASKHCIYADKELNESMSHGKT